MDGKKEAVDRQRRKAIKTGIGMAVSASALASCATDLPPTSPPTTPDPTVPDGSTTTPVPPTPTPDPVPRSGANRVRVPLSSLSATHPIINTYREAVRRMKALPPSDPRSWSRQAQIHNDHCPHGNWAFGPWHRAYLHFFEEICREVTGDEGFALPYWDWDNMPSIPAYLYQDVFDTRRTLLPGTTLSIGRVDYSNVDFITAFGRPGASGGIENIPHNFVHNQVGGQMRNPPTAAEDPIFWLHHAMVDRQFASWESRNRVPLDQFPELSNRVFQANFFDRDGDALSISVAESMALLNQGYRYNSLIGSVFARAFAAPRRMMISPIDEVLSEQVLQTQIAISTQAPTTVPVQETIDRNGGLRILVECPDWRATTDHQIAVSLKQAGQILETQKICFFGMLEMAMQCGDRSGHLLTFANIGTSSGDIAFDLQLEPLVGDTPASMTVGALRLEVLK
ncbi:MAG: tyrosinase family protein [Gammaproteobacteria bacterium]|nr:tyrosinase family protein [Gammaproteobacteria bacterium]